LGSLPDTEMVSVHHCRVLLCDDEPVTVSTYLQKSFLILLEVMGEYHPTGDASIYDTPWAGWRKVDNA